MCTCIHKLLNVFEDSAQRERTIVECRIPFPNTVLCRVMRLAGHPLVIHYSTNYKEAPEMLLVHEYY